jgi:TPR repeat protein
MHYLGLIYAAGTPGVPVDRELAESFAQRAVDHGMLRSVGLLAKIYSQRDDPRARQYLWRAVDVGDPEVISAAVDVCLYGKTPDPAKAVELVRRGALLGEPVFMEQYAMGLEMQTGGLKQDRVLARRLLRRAISMGNGAAEADWAYGQVTGAFGVEGDKTTGLATLKRMSDAGETDAQLLLARILIGGYYVMRYETAGFARVRTAAAHGDKRAKRELERQGLGVKGQ